MLGYVTRNIKLILLNIIYKNIKMTHRCENCKKKVHIVYFDCKCHFKILCTNCKLPETHLCKELNVFKEEGKNTIKKNNPIVISDKLIKI